MSRRHSRAARNSEPKYVTAVMAVFELVQLAKTTRNFSTDRNISMVWMILRSLCYIRITERQHAASPIAVGVKMSVVRFVHLLFSDVNSHLSIVPYALWRVFHLIFYYEMRALFCAANGCFKLRCKRVRWLQYTLYRLTILGGCYCIVIVTVSVSVSVNVY